MKKYYKDMVESPENKYRGNFHDGCMRYLDARDPKTNQWPLASNILPKCRSSTGRRIERARQIQWTFLKN